MSGQHTGYETVGTVLADREAIRKELAAARALLREVYDHSENFDLHKRICAYLDASDKQGGGHV